MGKCDGCPHFEFQYISKGMSIRCFCKSKAGRRIREYRTEYRRRGYIFEPDYELNEKHEEELMGWGKYHKEPNWCPIR